MHALLTEPARRPEEVCSSLSHLCVLGMVQGVAVLVVTTQQALGELLVQSEEMNDPGGKEWIFPLLGYLCVCVDL